MKIAPTLTYLMTHNWWDPSYDAAGSEADDFYSRASRELLALKAVAKAAERLADGWAKRGIADEGAPELLVRALARLWTASGAKY